MLFAVFLVIIGMIVIWKYTQPKTEVVPAQQTGIAVTVPVDTDYTEPDPNAEHRLDYDTPVYHTTDQEINTVNTTAIPLTKTIEFVKDNTGSGLTTEDEKTFQVAEVKAYSDRLLTTKDYSSAKYGADNTSNYFSPYNAIDGDDVSFSHTKGNQDIHRLFLDLVTPQRLTKLDIYCRSGYGARLSGTRVNLLDEKGAILDTVILNSQEMQTFTPMY